MVSVSDPKAVHRGDLPERPRALDVHSLGFARGLLELATSATADGDHKDAIGYVRQALDLLGRMVGPMVPTRAELMRNANAPKADPLVAAKERLAQWLVAEPGRAWDYEDRPFGTDCHVVTLTSSEEQRDIRRHDAREVGPDLASAIISALDAANGGDRG